jgi:hypothetical protein
MHFSKASIVASLLALPAANAETVLGVYMFHRHGDRTDKTHGAELTDLGYDQVYASGQFYRNRYIVSDGTNPIYGIASDVVIQGQIYVSAPSDNTLMNSAAGFLQSLYPPVGETLGSQVLRNGSTVQSPMNGYQLIPVHLVSGGAGSESSTWLQGSTGCFNAITSSAEYYNTTDYKTLANATQAFYKNLTPALTSSLPNSSINYKNAYTIFDLLNVANIHNVSYAGDDLITPETLFQVRTLADHHELSLAYNQSAPVRAIAGAVLGAQILDALNTTITTNGTTPLNIQFGSYGTFQSLFGLSGLLNASTDFYGIPDYASVMTFEAFTNASTTPYPATSDIRVRFLFHNATTNASSLPTQYPLFNQAALDLSWSDFEAGMSKFAVGSQSVWCNVCGNSTGVCASTSTSSSSSSTGSCAASTGTASAASISSNVPMMILTAIVGAVVFAVSI